MEQFLVSYWWLVILGIIVIGIITKKILNMFVSLVVIGLVAAVIWKMVVSPGFAGVSNCLNTATEEGDAITERAKNMGSGTERNKYICSRDEASYNKLVGCVEGSKEENPLAFAIYSKTPSFKKVFTETVESHNEACPGSVLTKPDFLK